MAKIVYSALVDTIRKKLQGSVMSQWKGINVIKSGPTPRQPRSEKQQFIRGIMNNLAGDWYGRTSAEKELWKKYASLLPTALTGLNAYLKLNSNLWRYLGSAFTITAPPPTPSTPEALVGFALTVTDSLNNSLAWTTPTAVADYVIVDYSVLAGLDDGANPRWSFAAGASASASPATHAHTYPVGSIMRYRGRVMDSYGRVSPNTEALSGTVA